MTDPTTVPPPSLRSAIIALERTLIEHTDPALTPRQDAELQYLLLMCQRARHFLESESSASFVHREGVRI